MELPNNKKTCSASIVTVSFGSYDSIPYYGMLSPRLSHLCFFAFTDEHNTPPPSPWVRMSVPPRWAGATNRVKSRVVKMLSHHLLVHARVIFYVDGKLKFASAEDIEALYRLFISSSVEWMSPIHPTRNTVMQEAFCLYLSNLTTYRVFQHVRSIYNASQMYTDVLLEGEWHIRRVGPASNTAAERWFQAYMAGTELGNERDQISLPYALHGVRTARVSTSDLPKRYGIKYRVRSHTVSRPSYTDRMLHRMQRALPWLPAKVLAKNHNWCSLVAYMVEERNTIYKLASYV